MSLSELSSILKDVYENAPYGNATTMIHLFGVKYARDIENADFTVKDILISAGMPISYQTEISKGVRLAKYVCLK